MSTSCKTNIVFIMTDNQQASTLGCYGNSEIHTPNLDRLAAGSVVFDNAFCPNTLCSPCRASALTGLLPSQHGVHSWIDDRSMDQWPVGWHALQGLASLPEMLKGAGYTTALIGKYHLGDPKTPMPGFDRWVTLEDGHIRSFYRNRMIDNGQSYDHEGHTVDFFTQKAVGFLEKSAATAQPFFLFLPYPAPYGHWPATKETDRCRHSDRYDACPMASVPRVGVSRAAVAEYDRMKADSGGGLDYSMLLSAPNDLATLRNYYAQISMVDDGVGVVMDTLDRLGLADNTLVIYTSDHGFSLGEHGFWGHGVATFPANMHRAAHSVPLIMRHPSASPRRVAAMVSNMDAFSTILDTVGLPRPEGAHIVASRSLCPFLEGVDAGWEEDAVYSEQEETRVVRTPKWVLFQRFAAAPSYPFEDELFDSEHDPDETTNLAQNPDFAEVRSRLTEMLAQFFAQHAAPRADLWQGGVPIQNTVRLEVWRDAWGQDWSPVYRYDS